MLLKRISVIVFNFILVFEPIFLQANNIVVDTSAQNKHQANLTTARNGTQVVNIVNPNGSGLSHNKFSEYSISNQNAILNNATSEVNTQLAGIIDRNPNLTQSAATILNEVTGTSRTNLEGYTEIAGQSANVIIANPNGVYVKGGGFINVPQATLTTGRPVFDNDVLKSFNVNQGIVEFDGENFNASNINQVDIYAKAIKLNAKIYAKNLNLITGLNTINTSAIGKYQSYIKNSDDNKEAFALSSTLLGGIYGDKINFIGTQAGVGVNFPTEILSQDDLAFDVNGDIILNKVSAKNNMSLEANNIQVNDIYANDVLFNALNTVTNNKTVASKNSLKVIANKVENKGNIAVGVNSDNSISSSLSQEASFKTNSFINDGIIYNQNNITFENKDNLVTNTFVNNSKIISDKNITIESESITSTNGVFDATENLELRANNLLVLNDSLALSNYLNFNSKTFNSSNSSINANTNLSITSTDINHINTKINDKNTRANTLNNVNLDATNSITLDKDSSLLSNNKIYIKSFILNSDASMQVNGSNANNEIELVTNSLKTRGDLKAKDINLNTTTLDNYGAINATNLNITSNSLTNYGGVSGIDSFVITSNDLINYNTLFSPKLINLYISNNLTNQTDPTKVPDITKALIYASDSINIQGNKDKTQRTNSLLNKNAIIQTNLGDINLFVNEINNNNSEAQLQTNPSSNVSFKLYESNKNGIYFTSLKKFASSSWDGGDLISTILRLSLNGLNEIETSIRNKYLNKYFSHTKNVYGVEGDTKGYNTFDSITINRQEYSNSNEFFYREYFEDDGGDGGSYIAYEAYYIDKSKNASELMRQYNQEVFQALKDKYEPYGLKVIQTENNNSWLTIKEKNTHYSHNYRYGRNREWKSAGSDIQSYAIKLDSRASTNNTKTIICTGDGLACRGRRSDLTYTKKGSQSYFSIKPTSNVGSEILSGNNLNIDSINFNNNISKVTARNDINFNNSSVKNKSLAAWDKEEILIQNHKGVRLSAYSKSPVSTPTEQYNAVIEAGNDIKGTVKSFMNDELSNSDVNIKNNTTVNNEIKTYDLTNSIDLTQNTVQRESLNSSLPINRFGRFVANLAPEHKYLIETNPLYNTFESYYSSDYFLNKMTFNPNAHLKRLGDAAYETELVRNAIVNHTGRQYALSNESINNQYKNMMDNAVNMAGILNLEIGISPTEEQLANLTQDIVWLEIKQVDGIDVLAPVVYFANDYKKSNGALLVANNNIDLTIENDFENTGTIQSNNLNINANSITNKTGTITSNEVTQLISKNDIKNSNGATIKAGSLALTSTEGSILNDTYVNTQTINTKRSKSVYTAVGQKSSLESTKGNLVLNAKKDINNNAGDIKSASSIGLYTQEGDINIISKENDTSYYWKRGKNFDKGRILRHVQSDIQASQDIVLNSKGKLNLTATNINAGNDLHTNSEDDMSVLAVNNIDYKDKQRHTKRSFGRSKTTRNMTYKEAVVGSNLNANNIRLNSEKNITLEAANLKAKENIIVDAKGNIDVTAKQYREGKLKYTKKSGFGGFSKSVSMDKKDVLNLKEAKLTTEAKNIILKSKNDIKIIASELNSADEIQLQAANELLISAANEYAKEEKWSKKTRFNLGSLLVSLGTGGLLNTGPIYELNLKQDEKATAKAKSSSITSGGNLTIDAGNAKVVGSNISASKDIVARTDVGSIEVLSAKETEDKHSIEKKIEVGLANIIEITNSLHGLNNKKGDTKLKITLAKATYDKVDSTSNEVTNKASNVTSDKNITLDSIEDINVVGSNIEAKEDITLKAEQNINIKEAVNTSNSNTKETHAKAEVNLTVQNEYVEAAKAYKEVDEARKQVQTARKDYKKYKSDVKSLEARLVTIKEEYKNKTPGISKEDIDDLSEIISDIKSDEKYYIASIAASVANLTSKTTLAMQQTQAALSSNATYGFSAGLSLDVEGSKTKTNTSTTTAVASNIKANNISIETKTNTNNKTLISGSNVKANENLNINTKDLDIVSSTNTTNSNSDTKDISGSVSMTVYGTASGPQVSLGYGEQHNSQDSVTNNNSKVEGNNITITTSNDTNIKGAKVKADDTLTLNVGNDLNIESQRDTHNSNSKGFNVSAGLGLGTDSKLANTEVGLRTSNGEVSSANAAFGANKGRVKVKETVVTSVTGDKVEVNVGNNTNLKGSVLASGKYDENGNLIDNENLKVNTKTLTYQDSSNVVYDTSNSFNIGANLGVGKESKNTTTNSTTDSKDGTKINSSNFSYSNNKTYSKTKTLATLGKGEVNISDTENSDDTTALNRDTQNTKKDIYDVNTGVKIDMTLDHNAIKFAVNKLAEAFKNINIENLPKPTEKQIKFNESFKEANPEEYERISKILIDNYIKQQDIKHNVANEQRTVFLQIVIPLALATYYANAPQDKTDVHTDMTPSAEFTAIGGAIATGQSLLNGKNITDAAIDIVSNKLKVKRISQSWAKDFGLLREITSRKGNFGMGTANSSKADELGKAWVGDGYRLSSDGKAYVSKDGLRVYRPPSKKPNSQFATTGVQANFQKLAPVKDKHGNWKNKVISNGHLDIIN